MAVISTAIQDDINATIPNVGALQNALMDKLLRWFQAGGATSNDVQDAERQFLVARGETERDTQDMWEHYLRVTLGLGTLALDDLQKKYWGGAGGGPVGESGFGVADLSTLNLGPATFVRATTAMSFFKPTAPYSIHSGGGAILSTLSLPNNAIPGAFAVIVDAALFDWTAANNVLCSRWGGAGTLQFWFASTGSALSLGCSRDGTAATFPASAAHGFTANSRHKIAADFNPNGDVKFYEQIAGVWTLITATTTTAGVLFQSVADINVGSQGAGGGPSKGKIYSAEIRLGGLAGPIIASMSPSDNLVYPAAATWVSSSPNKETWTINDNTSANPTRIVKGELISVGAGFARHWNDPATGNPMGVLIEGQRTNLALRSQEFGDAAWPKTDITVTSDTALAPDGTFTADLITEGVAGTAGVFQAYTGTANAVQSYSVWVKRNNHDWVFLQIYEAAAPANVVRAFFNLATGAVGSVNNGGTGTLAAGKIEAYPNGWYRVEVSGQVNNAATALSTNIASATADNNIARVNNAARLQWGAQIENTFNFCSTYIPTVAATVTRNNDSLSFTNPGIDARGAVVCEISTLWGANHPTINSAVFGVTAGTSAMFMNNAAAPTHIRANDGTNSPQKSGLNSCQNVTRKRGLSWGALGMNITGDGLAVVNSAYDGTIGSGVPLFLGNHSGLIQPMHGCIKSLKLYAFEPTALQLAAMTG